MFKRDHITLFQGEWGNVFVEWDFRSWDIIPRLTYSRFWGNAQMLIFGIFCIRIQLSVWSKPLREALAKEDNHDALR